MTSRLARAHWLHWLLLGGTLNVILAMLVTPAPAPVIGPSADELASARESWFRLTGQPPNQREAAALASDAADRAILFAEALARGYHLDDPLVRDVLVRGMRFADPNSMDGGGEDDAALFRRALDMQLHRHDPVVRRRLVQRMEMQATPAQANPSDADLRALYERQREQHQLPPSLRLRQRFFSAERHAEPMREARRQLRSQHGDLADDIGNPFLHGELFPALTPARAAQLFGAAFADALFALPERSGRWQGPVRSAYGAHLVQIDDWRPSRRLSLDEVREPLLADWRRGQKQRALRALLQRLRERYAIIDPS